MPDITAHAEAILMAARKAAYISRNQVAGLEDAQAILAALRAAMEDAARAMRDRCAIVGFDVVLPLSPGLADGASMTIDAYVNAIRNISPADIVERK